MTGMRDSGRTRALIDGLHSFLNATPAMTGGDGSAWAAAVYHRAVDEVPAYRAFLVDRACPSTPRRPPTSPTCRWSPRRTTYVGSRWQAGAGAAGWRPGTCWRCRRVRRVRRRSGRGRCWTNCRSPCGSSRCSAAVSGPMSDAPWRWCASRSGPGSAGCTRRPVAGTWPPRVTRSPWSRRATMSPRSSGSSGKSVRCSTRWCCSGTRPSSELCSTPAQPTAWTGPPCTCGWYSPGRCSASSGAIC
jgi:hypothetical protein